MPKKGSAHPLAEHALTDLANRGANVEGPDRAVTVALRPELLAGAGSVTPLMLAAHEGKEDMVRQLIVEGADIHATTSFPKAGITALMAASERGHAKVVELLLSAGASTEGTPGSKDWDFGAPPLVFAAENGHEATVRILLDAGAGKSRRDLHSALRCALSKGHSQIAAILRAAGAKLRGGTASGGNILGAAIEGNCIEYVRELLDDGVSPNEFVLPDLSAIELAVMEGRSEIEALLAARGADVNGSSDLPPLMWAAAQGNLAQMNLLLKSGANVNARTSESRTALHLASRDGQIEAAKRLLDAGAEIDPRDSDGKTPFFMACEQWQTAVAKFLFEHGVDSTVVDDRGRSILDATKEQHVRFNADISDCQAMLTFIEGLGVGSTAPRRETMLEIAAKPWPEPPKFVGRKSVRELARAISSELGIRHKSFRKTKNSFSWQMSEEAARRVAGEWLERAMKAFGIIFPFETTDAWFLILVPSGLDSTLDMLQMLNVTPASGGMSSRLLALRLYRIYHHYWLSLRAAGPNWMCLYFDTSKTSSGNMQTLARKLDLLCQNCTSGLGETILSQLEKRSEVVLRWD